MTEMRKIRPSLLERAAEIYDFDAHLRARQAPVPAPEPQTELMLEPAFEADDDAAAMPWETAPAAVQPVAKPTPARIEEPVYRRPHAGGASVRIDRAMLSEKGLLVPGAPIGALVEEFRQVKRQLMLTARAIRANNPGPDAVLARTILVCSANANEGKTYCAVNLAISMAAERETEILLVDGDIAKPDVMNRLGHKEGPGLLDALADTSIDVESCVVGTDIPQLSLLPAGTRSNTDTELLASDRMQQLIARLLAADPRRIVIFDSPPALAASPASVLAGEVGQVMLVVRADKTSDGDLRQAVTGLDGCEHIQLILNAVSFAPSGRRFGSYYEEQDDSK